MPTAASNVPKTPMSIPSTIPASEPTTSPMMKVCTLTHSAEARSSWANMVTMSCRTFVSGEKVTASECEP